MNWDVWRSHGRIFAYLLMSADGGSDGHTAEQRSFRNPVHSLEKKFSANHGADGKRILRMRTFWSLNPSDANNRKWGNPKHENIVFRKFL